MCIILDSGSLEDAYLPAIHRHVSLVSWPPPAGQVNCAVDSSVDWLHTVAIVSRLDTHPTHTVAQGYTHETMACVTVSSLAPSFLLKLCTTTVTTSSETPNKAHSGTLNLHPYAVI